MQCGLLMIFAVDEPACRNRCPLRYRGRADQLNSKEGIDYSSASVKQFRARIRSDLR
jgi:hypothetical protein